MRIVALHAVRAPKWLALVRLLQIGGFRIMTINAERRRGLLQVKVEFLFPRLARLVRRVARVAAHIQRGVTTAFLGHVQPLRVAIEAEILAFVACHRFQQLILIFRDVRAVALQAIAHRGRMHMPLDLRGIHVRMAGNAERLRRRGDQLDARDIF